MQNSRQAYVNLGLATLAFAVAFIAWSLISPLASQIQKDYGLDNTAISFLMEHAGLSFPEAVGELAQSVGLTVPQEPSPMRGGGYGAALATADSCFA